MEDCLFCRIVAGSVPSARVYEDERTIAILDIFPATRGHALVIPRAHSTDVHDAARADVLACAVAAQTVAGMAAERLGADGVTILQSNGPAAWQTVFHYHVHVIPRYEGDPLRLPWTPPADPAAARDLQDISRSYSQD